MTKDPGDRQGLCPRCRWHRVIENRRGTRFILCERAAWDERLQRYPPLPVLECVGYEEAGSREQ